MATVEILVRVSCDYGCCEATAQTVADMRIETSFGDASTRAGGIVLDPDLDAIGWEYFSEYDGGNRCPEHKGKSNA